MCLWASIVCIGIYDSNAQSDKRGNKIQTAIKMSAKQLLNDPKINAVSIGVYKAGRAYSGHYGELDKGKGNVPNDATIYEIASVSKSFTGALVAQAVIDKKLSLEDDIRKYLEGNYSNLEYQSNPIRVKHLITHTAGLPKFLPASINALFNNIDENLPFRIYNIEKAYTREAFLKDLKTVTINIVPGTQYRYSNADVELMAHILEKAYNLSFEKLLLKYITGKAHLKSTKVHLSNQEKRRLANGYGETNKLVPHFANTLWGAGSGIKSTLPDLINYMKFQLDDNNQAVKASHQVLYAQENMQMGYLWPILNSSEDGTYYRIHGGAFGTQNFLMIVPKYNLGISIITNQSGPETQPKLLNALNNLFAKIK
ncbi:hypothetical protein BKI52_41225 [marine bacterium AO1-C]|nr:hypothetical protein BKI52_41225 [marine bacterium AO1-C]